MSDLEALYIIFCLNIGLDSSTDYLLVGMASCGGAVCFFASWNIYPGHSNIPLHRHFLYAIFLTHEILQDSEGFSCIDYVANGWPLL